MRRGGRRMDASRGMAQEAGSGIGRARSPGRVRLSSAELSCREAELARILRSCRLCPQACGADREAGELGRCGIGPGARVASFGPHFGEEGPLVGRYGSGTVFFSGCNLACVFCQNFETSQLREGIELGVRELADVFLSLDRQGCHNLNLVTPTHQAPAIVAALAIAREEGCELPVVWNCGGYESVEVLELLAGVVDIYMPDAKYGDDETALLYSGAAGYARNLGPVLREMHRQVGDLLIERGIARQGLLVRHLILPGGMAGSESVLRMIASALGTRTYVNVMDQYRPAYQALRYPKLARRPSPAEIAQAFSCARALGLVRGLDAC